MKKIALILSTLFLSTYASAANIDCGFLDIRLLYVQADRSDGGGA